MLAGPSATGPSDAAHAARATSSSTSRPRGLDLRRDTLVAVGAVGVARGRIAIGDAYSAVLRQARPGRMPTY